jgi:Ni2+-binding GTPase involved in maturation of urease and hydrogenase
MEGWWWWWWWSVESGLMPRPAKSLFVPHYFMTMHHRLLSMMATALLWRTATASRQRPFHAHRALAFLSNKCNVRNSNAIQRSHIPIATAFSENRYMTTTTTAVSSTASSIEDVTKKPIPIILLAGFLGAGKTSTLKFLLENNVNVRIGTIVNDVASVNIDAKLVSNVIGNINNSNNNIGDGSSNSAEADPNNYYANGGIVELQNGCACCSLADELLTSVITLTDSGQRKFDAIVVELSGVADPMSVRDNWEQARLVSLIATYFYLHTTHTLLLFVILFHPN